MRKMIVFVVIALIVAASPPAGAQKPATIARIGYLVLASGLSTNFEAFRGGLRDLGYVEGQNIAIEYRSAESVSRLIEQASDLVRLKVDVIVAQGGAAIVPAKGATNVIPIVFGHSADPVEAGFIHSLARPGGNLTGMTFLSYELSGKRLELLREAVPKASRVAVLANPSHPGEQRELREVQTTARNLGATVQYLQTKTSSDFDSAFEAILRERTNALLVFPDAVTLGSRSRIAEFATTSRLPSIFGWKEYVEAGGLMSYGPNLGDSYRRLAVYVDKILKGAKPADLPVEQPTKFEMVINLKTAKQIGLTIPQWVLMRADKVIR